MKELMKIIELTLNKEKIEKILQKLNKAESATFQHATFSFCQMQNISLTLGS
jgi:hypothetical protein